MTQPSPHEQVYYQDASGVLVSTSRFVVGSTMYPIRGITAVQAILIPPDRNVAKFVAILGLCALCLIGSAREVSVALCVLLLAGAIYLAVHAKPTGVVRISTAGGQADAIKSKDVAAIQQIVTALHRATMGG